MGAGLDRCYIDLSLDMFLVRFICIHMYMMN
jgi:hypothetical protein